MQSSSQYYSDYLSHKADVMKCDQDMRTLAGIKNSLSGDFSDRQNRVNGEIDELKEALNRAVRYDPKFQTIASEGEAQKEKDTSADSKLNDAVINLENEIADLNNKRSMADQQANQSYQDFLTAQREEHEAWLNSLRNRW